MPRSRQARTIRTAISPRLATSTRLIVVPAGNLADELDTVRPLLDREARHRRPPLELLQQIDKRISDAEARVFGLNRPSREERVNVVRFEQIPQNAFLVDGKRILGRQERTGAEG